MSNLIQREFQGQMFSFREDGYFNMTEAANNFGKQLNNFWMSPPTIEYLEALEKTLDSNVYLREATRGRNGGTWGHPKLAVFFARWLSPAFAVFCDAVIDDILNKKASLTIDKPDESFAMKVPQSLPEALRMAADLAEKNERLQVERDGVVKTIGKYGHTGNRVARTLAGVNTNAAKSDLHRLGYLYKRGGALITHGRYYLMSVYQVGHSVTP